MRGPLRPLPLVIGLLLLAACSDAPLRPSSPSAPSFEIADGGPVPSLNLYGAGGLARTVPSSPCLAGAYRQFDFWIGAWNVFNPAGVQVGTNTVTGELDGCLIAEHWTGAGGVRGRSINTYDAETGQWHQTWVTANTIGHLRMAGGLVDGEMVLRGVRESVFGFPFFDDFTWTVLSPDRVRQVGVLRIPAIGLVSTFTGIYERADEVTPAPEQPTTQCAPGGISAESRRLDFWAGEWRVETEHGLALGESTVRTDLRDCLFEERFTTPQGYAAVAFTYWDRVVGRWYRTYIDSEGERLELAGAFAGDRLVLRGPDGAPEGSVELRVTVAPRTGGGVDQTVEVSRDGGATWRPALGLRFLH